MPKMTDRTTISMRAATRTLLASRRTLRLFPDGRPHDH
jgi:hypothetical protein